MPNPFPSPTSYAGLWAWADADFITGTPPALSNWQDHSGSGHDFNLVTSHPPQIAPITDPVPFTTISGKAAVSFYEPNTEGCWTTVEPPFTTFANVTVIAVVQPAIIPQPISYGRICVNDYVAGFYLGFDVTGTKFMGLINNSSLNTIVSGVLTAGVPYIVALVFDSTNPGGGTGTATLYVNGVAVSSGTCTTPTGVTDAPVSIGFDTFFTEPLYALVRHCCVYTTALSASDIASLGDYFLVDLGLLTVGPTLLSALAIRENVVQLTFDQPIFFTELLDTEDGSNPTKYTFTPDEATVGLDGDPPRPVNASSIALAIPIDEGGDLPAGATQGAVVDVTLDRPMSPYPGAYTVAVVGIYDVTATETQGSQSVSFPAVYRRLQANSTSVAGPMRDFANPSTGDDVEGSALAVPLPPGAEFNLGSFQVDDSGDYAWDAGLTSIKKRILRRGLSSKGAFLHLPSTYGVGFLDQVKQLGTAHMRDALAADWEAQIRQEPEVIAVQVTSTTDPNNPNLVMFQAQAQTTSGPVTVSTGFNTATGDVVDLD
jgi:hypothetical protein